MDGYVGEPTEKEMKLFMKILKRMEEISKVFDDVDVFSSYVHKKKNNGYLVKLEERNNEYVLQILFYKNQIPVETIIVDTGRANLYVFLEEQGINAEIDKELLEQMKRVLREYRLRQVF